MPKIPGPIQRQRDINQHVFGADVFDPEANRPRSFAAIIKKMAELGVSSAALRFEKHGTYCWTFSCYFKGSQVCGWFDKAAPLYECMVLKLLGIQPYAQLDFQLTQSSEQREQREASIRTERASAKKIKRTRL